MPYLITNDDEINDAVTWALIELKPLISNKL